MAQTTDTTAILVADIARTTHIYESLGDSTAKKLIDASKALISEVTEKYQGTVVKSVGDETMCTFPTANDAVEAAVEMNLSLDDMPFPDNPDFGTPNLYIGVQFGKVIREDDDVYGDAVNVASRMVGLAGQRQIVTTESTVKLLSQERQSTAQYIDNTKVKGKSGGLGIYEVVWEENDLAATAMATQKMEIPTLKAHLELTYQGQTITLHENRPIATMGRQKKNDLVVDNDRASRSHARIEYNQGKFTLIDQSSNGTIMKIKGQKSVLLKRKGAQLKGSGVIGLGRKVKPESKAAVHFVVKS